MRGERGIAQLMVLWALLLLGTLAAGFSLSMRTEAQAARHGVDDARAYYQARTGVSKSMMLLSTLPLDNVMRMDIEGQEDDASYRVRVASESGKFDINYVSEDDLLEILKKGGLTETEAVGLRDAIMDWKDTDDDIRPHGAERNDYAHLSEPLRPRNGNLRGIGELRYIKGVTREFFDRFLSRVFTVHGNASQVNVLHASEAVLNAIPGVSSEAVAEILEMRRKDFNVSPAELADMAGRGLLTDKGLSMISGRRAARVFEIVATGRAGTGVVHTIRCLMDISGAGNNKVRILKWQDLAPREREG
jgi:general secretion pathway protein K